MCCLKAAHRSADVVNLENISDKHTCILEIVKDLKFIADKRYEISLNNGYNFYKVYTFNYKNESSINSLFVWITVFFSLLINFHSDIKIQKKQKCII